ncbi:pheromone-processing carboxypeptidase KEX1-like [Mangifera indica]|uniref:pheromone-processing carboxypeptidase KEX1-like n=1 Tax=Mangifera indica TaxID=29780 RepID=UPI001CFAB769|nr:pheromone-processing carboxypeptidase KEX1-like [Mangifera indica]XP_044495610.1 pheromone-processing carboxypeptidase KEX1-like [Mangifera indica]
MAYRGRGHGRGFRGRASTYAKQEAFKLFPDIELPNSKNVPVDKNLIIWNSRLLNYWKSSPYYLEENVEKKSQSMDIERFSDLIKPRTSTTRDSIDQILQLTANNFPQELIKGSRGQRSTKRVRWNTDAGLQRLDLFEKLEQKNKGEEEKDEKEKKDGEKEGENLDEDDDEAAGDAEEESSDDGDYNQNVEFDDDEDDFNMDDGDDDEATY